MTLNANGFYYDHEGVRYRRYGIVGQYTFEQVASIIERALSVHVVLSPMANTMVTRALEYVDPNTLSDIHTRLEKQYVASDED